MDDRPRVFLDTSVLVALTLSTRERPPGRLFFEMAIHGLIDIIISHHVTAELEGVLRERTPDKAPSLVASIAENLVLARAITAADPNDSTVQECFSYTDYKPDAKVLAAAIEAAAEVLVTLDRQHLLGNKRIGPPNTDLVVMDVSEALEWCRDQVSVRSRARRQR